MLWAEASMPGIPEAMQQDARYRHNFPECPFQLICLRMEWSFPRTASITQNRKRISQAQQPSVWQSLGQIGTHWEDGTDWHNPGSLQMVHRNHNTGLGHLFLQVSHHVSQVLHQQQLVTPHAFYLHELKYREFSLSTGLGPMDFTHRGCQNHKGRTKLPLDLPETSFWACPEARFDHNLRI